MYANACAISYHTCITKLELDILQSSQTYNYKVYIIL